MRKLRHGKVKEVAKVTWLVGAEPRYDASQMAPCPFLCICSYAASTNGKDSCFFLVIRWVSTESGK